MSHFYIDWLGFIWFGPCAAGPLGLHYARFEGCRILQLPDGTFFPLREWHWAADELPEGCEQVEHEQLLPAFKQFEIDAEMRWRGVTK